MGNCANRLLLGLLLSLAVGAASATVILSDGFESGDRSSPSGTGTWDGSGADVTVATTNPKTGSYSLKLVHGPDAEEEDSDTERRFFLEDNYSDVWVQYDLYIPSNYTHRTQTGSANNKFLLHMWEGDYGTPVVAIGIEVWPDGTGDSYASVHEFAPNDPGHIHNSDPAWNIDEFITAYDKGKWMQVVVHMKYATSANDDGVVEIWKTPSGGSKTKVFDKTDMAIYTASQTGFDTAYLFGAANSGFAAETILYIDNIIVATTEADLGPEAPAVIYAPVLQ